MSNGFFQMVGNKQDLFDNVVDPEGTEDIIGISRKSLAEVVDDLAKEAEDTDGLTDKESEKRASQKTDEEEKT